MVNRKNKVFVRRKNTGKYLPRHIMGRVQKGGGSVGIWGCISGKGAGCHQIYTGRLDQYGYRDILDNTLQASRDLFEADETWTFQQDNAPCHTARTITEYMAEINRTYCLGLPVHPISIRLKICGRGWIDSFKKSK